MARFPNATRCAVVLTALMSGFLVVTMVCSVASAEIEVLTMAVDLQDSVTLEDDLRFSQFELDPPSTEVRVATHATYEQIGDLIKQYDLLREEPKELDWDEQFETTTEGQIVPIEREEEDDFDLMPSPVVWDDASNSIGLVSAHSPLAEEISSVSLCAYDDAKTVAPMLNFDGEVHVNPEPSGWTLTFAMLASLVVIGGCARWIRSGRDDVQRIEL